MSEYKAGLHKKISAIFDGVPIPKSDSISPPPYVPAAGQSLALAPKPPVPTKQSSAQPPAKTPPQTQTQTSAPKSQQTAPPPSKAASPKPQKNSAAVIAGQSSLHKLFSQLKTKLLKPKQGVSFTRQKLMTILIPVLFVIFIFVFIRLFSAPAQKTAKPLKTAGADTPVVVPAEKISWKIPDLYPETLRDPMRLGSSTAASAQDSAIIIRGIVYSEDNPAVIIGTQVLHRGSKVSGATIVKISEDEAEFEMNGKKWTQKVQN